jgi:hypothetical protein
MPRTVRNFYIKAHVDGRTSLVAGGPRARDGGLILTVYQRCEGRVEKSLQVVCTASNGTLRVCVEPMLPSCLREDGTLWIDTSR